MESPNCQSGDESLSQKLLVNEVVSEKELSKLPFPNEDERRSALLLVHVWSRAYRIARRQGWQDVDCEDIAQETLIKFLFRVHFKGTIERFTRRKVRDIKSRLWGLRKKRKEISYSQRDGFDIEERAIFRIREAEEILEWIHLNSSLRRFKMLYECHIDGYSVSVHQSQCGFSRRGLDSRGSFCLWQHRHQQRTLIQLGEHDPIRKRHQGTPVAATLSEL